MRLSLFNMLLLLVAFTSLVGSGLVRVWVNKDAVQTGYELSSETRRQRQLEETKDKLAIEVAQEHAPDRLREVAKRLGMQPPSAGRIFGEEAQ